MDTKVTFFLGANAPGGFYSLYDELIPPAAARRVFLLKGGAGCGKSTLMRRVGSALEEAGERCEYIVCSGDPDSLDGVVFPDLGAAIVDATAPHVREPSLPGAVDSYVDLGRFYDHRALAPLREELAAATAAYQSHYPRAYRCLSACAQLREDDRELVDTPALEAKLTKRAKGILSREVKKTAGALPGKVTKRFLGAVTCKGQICRFDTALALCPKVYALSDSFGLAHGLLEVLCRGAVAAGHDVIACPSPLFPERLEHLLIPDLGLAFLTSSPDLPVPGKPYRRLRLDAMAEPETMRRFKHRLKLSRKVSAALLNEGVEALARAKWEHDKLEKLYNPHVDFAGVEEQSKAITEELLELRGG